MIAWSGIANRIPSSLGTSRLMVVLCWLLNHTFVGTFRRPLHWCSRRFSGWAFVVIWFLSKWLSGNHTNYAWPLKSFTSFLAQILFEYVCSLLCTLNHMFHGLFTAWAHKYPRVVCMAIRRLISYEGLCMFIRETSFCLWESLSLLIEIKIYKI